MHPTSMSPIAGEVEVPVPPLVGGVTCAVAVVTSSRKSETAVIIFVIELSISALIHSKRDEWLAWFGVGGFEMKADRLKAFSRYFELVGEVFDGLFVLICEVVLVGVAERASH